MASSDKDRIRELEATVRLLAHRISQLESAGASSTAAAAATMPPSASPAYANSITSKKVGGLYSPPATPPGAGSTAAPAAATAATGRPAYDFGATPAAARVSPALKASGGGGDDPFASMLDTPHHRREESRFVAPVVSSSAGAAAAPAGDAAAAPTYDDGAIAAGMRIRILSDREEVMRSCELSTVGWRASKEAMLGKTGTVTEVDAQAARVRLNGGQECWFPKPVLTPIPALHSPPGSRHDDGGSVGEANAQLLLRYSAANAHAAHATAVCADESLTSAHRVLARARDRSPTPPPPAAAAMREAMVGRGFSPPPPVGSGGGVASRRASGVSAGVVGPAASPARSGRALPAHVSSVAALRSFPHSDAAAAASAATPARRFSYSHAVAPAPAGEEGVPAYSSVAASAAGAPRVLEAPAAAAVAAAARRASVAEAAAYDAALTSAVRPSAVVAAPVGGGGATPGGGSVYV